MTAARAAGCDACNHEVIFAETEDWEHPLCYDCMMAMPQARERLGRERASRTAAEATK